MSEKITLALPSKGAIAQPTYDFLKNSGLKVHKPNPRQYVGSIPAIQSMNVLFQRVKDVAYKVADGTAELGVTGYDVVCEHNNDNLVVIHDKLGYGHCQLVVAVPEAWVDVETILDLTEVALDFREQQGRNIRIATTYTGMTREFFHRQQMHHFTLVKADGAIEAAPTIGYADIIVDLTQTGTTLRENHLKQISGGTIVDSQACLIGNRQALKQNPNLLEATRIMLEYMDAALQGRQYFQVHVDMKGETAEDVARLVMQNTLTEGLIGPTIAPIYTRNGDRNGTWHTVTITVSNKNLLETVSYLRSIGGTHTVVTPVNYVFREESSTYVALLEKLNLKPVSESAE